MPDLPAQCETSHESRRDGLRYYARRLQRHPAVRSWRQPVRTAKIFLPSMWRLATHELRQLPSVVIAGAQKAGTTQLYAYLVKHPRLFPSWKKEVDYFSKHPQRSIKWYRSHFPLRRRVAAVGGQTVDASPSYLPMPAALRKMHTVLPEARVIAVLRDPVARAFSHYQHYKTRGLESRSFDEAVDAELRHNDFPAESGVALRHSAAPMLGYVSRGYYALQLELLFELYAPERVLLVDSVDLFGDTSTVCQRVFEFLGLDQHRVQPTKIYNRGYYKEQINPAVADRLREHYRPYDARLSELVGRSFCWMAVPMAA
jgi:Sulfotransferase domain